MMKGEWAGEIWDKVIRTLLEKYQSCLITNKLAYYREMPTCGEG